MKKIFVMALLLSGCGIGSAETGSVGEGVLVVDASRPGREISKQLTGSHFVYAKEADNIYTDQRIAQWMNDSRVGVIRWPGGTAVQTYHWDSLNGIAFVHDSWDPLYDQVGEPAEKYMDLDEYIAYCRKVGAEPMVGINTLSGKKFNREADAQDEARRLVTYCKNKNYNVKHWYIGNEGYTCGFGPKLYARYIDDYAEIIKSVDPDVMIIADWKFGPEEKNRYDETLEIVRSSKEVDMIEMHEKWGVEWGLYSGKTFEEWKNQTPIYNGLMDDYIKRFHRDVAAMGRSDVKLAFNEWGLGSISGCDQFQYGLVAGDFLLMLMRNDVEMACYWNLNMGGNNSRILNVTWQSGIPFLSSISPVGEVFKLLALAMGQRLLPLESPVASLYGLATLNEKGIEVYLVNKSDSRQELQLDVKGISIQNRTATISTYVSPGVVKNSKVNLDDKISFPPLSLCRLACVAK